MYAHFLQEGNLWTPDKPLQTLWGGQQPAAQMGRPKAAPQHPSQNPLPWEAFGEEVGVHAVPETRPQASSRGAGFKLNPIWRRRTLTTPIQRLGSPPGRPFICSFRPHQGPGSVSTHTGVTEDGRVAWPPLCSSHWAGLLRITSAPGHGPPHPRQALDSQTGHQSSPLAHQICSHPSQPPPTSRSLPAVSRLPAPG